MKKKILGFAILTAMPAAALAIGSVAGLRTQETLMLTIFCAVPLWLVIIAEAVKLIVD